MQHIIHGQSWSGIQKRARWRFKHCFVPAGWYRGFILKNPNIKVSIFCFFPLCTFSFFSRLLACLPPTRTPPVFWHVSSRVTPGHVGLSSAVCFGWSDTSPLEQFSRFTSRNVTISHHSKVASSEVMVPSTHVLAHLTQHRHSDAWWVRISISTISRPLINKTCYICGQNDFKTISSMKKQTKNTVGVQSRHCWV